MKKKLILIGGGGHCKSSIDIIESENKYEIIGILDLPEKLGCKVLNYPIIDTDVNVKKYISSDINFMITVGYNKSNPSVRKNLFDLIIKNGGILPVIISPRAYISAYCNIGAGTIVMHNAVINCDAFIGENCIVNHNVIVDHDCIVGSHTILMPGAIIYGGSVLDSSSYIK